MSILRLTRGNEIQDATARREALTRAPEIRRYARALLRSLPSECTALVAFSDEGCVVAAAAAALSASDLLVLRASHGRPLDPAPPAEWSWVSR